MKQILIIIILFFSHLSTYAQLSADKIGIVNSKVKPLERKDGFYGSTLRYLKNTPAFTPEFAVTNFGAIVNRGGGSCNYFSFELFDPNGKPKKGKIWRKTSCFCKDNQLYIKTQDKSRSYMKVLVQGYFTLLSCNPQDQDHSLGLSGVIGSSGTYDNPFGTIMNLGTFQMFPLTSRSLRKILVRNKELYEAYKKEDEPIEFETMIDYLVKLNEGIIKDY